MYGRSSARRRIGGSEARRRGTIACPRRSTLPAGRPLPWTASTKIRVISCERVRCSSAARRRSDSFNSLGTYAPINTPFRFAIWDILLVFSHKSAIALQMKRVYKPNLVPAFTGGDHSSRLFVTKQLERPTRKRRRITSTLNGPFISVLLFGLAPRGVYLAATVTSRAGELLPHPFTHHPCGLVCSLLHLSSYAFTHSRTLSGSLPFGVRTFLFVLRKRSPDALQLQG